MPVKGKNPLTKHQADSDRYHDSAPSHVKKAFAQLKRGTIFNLLKDLSDELGVRYYTPGWLGDHAVHFTFPKHRTAILIDTGVRRSIIQAKQREFARNGWYLAVIHQYDNDILSMDDSLLKQHLVSMLNN